MRNPMVVQLPLVGFLVKHEHAKEIQVISDRLDAMPGALQLVHSDLIRGLKFPEVGREGMSADQVLRILLIKQVRSFSYEQLTFELDANTTYREFCRIGLQDAIPAKTTIQENIKRIQPETLEAINRLILKAAAEEGIEKGRKVRIDATGVETNIHPPSDSEQLYDVNRVLTRIMLQQAEKFPFHFKNQVERAKRRRMNILNDKKTEDRTRHYRDLLKVTRKTINEARRIATLIANNGLEALAAATELRRIAQLGDQVVSQTERRVIKGENVPAAEKIFSIFEEHTDIIVKGKDKKEDILFGHKLTLTGGASNLILDCVIEDGNPADSTRAIPMIERQKDIYGRVPRQATFDGCYASKENLEEAKKLGVKDVAFSKKRGLEVEDMTKSPWVYRMLNRFRAGIESGISFLKRCMGLTRVTWHGETSFKAYVWSSIIAANLLTLSRHTIAA